MAWTWIRPTDESVMDGRPLLDVGTGDAQTLRALAPTGQVVAMDSSLTLLRTVRRHGIELAVAGRAQAIPLESGQFATVLAADLFHHLDAANLAVVLAEIRRVLRPDGKLVSWWYSQPGRHDPDAPDAPRYPREWEPVADMAKQAGFTTVDQLALTVAVNPSPPTAGLLAAN